MEEWLNDYFEDDKLNLNYITYVTYIADALHLSPNYLSLLLTSLTGQTTQQHIHNKLIEKEKLSTSNLSISEIVYQLGFQYLHSFSKLFKSKTNQSPLKVRQSIN